MRLYGFLLPKPKLSQVLAKQQSAVGCVLSTDTPWGLLTTQSKFPSQDHDTKISPLARFSGALAAY